MLWGLSPCMCKNKTHRQSQSDEYGEYRSLFIMSATVRTALTECTFTIMGNSWHWATNKYN